MWFWGWAFSGVLVCLCLLGVWFRVPMEASVASVKRWNLNGWDVEEGLVIRRVDQTRERVVLYRRVGLSHCAIISGRLLPHLIWSSELLRKFGAGQEEAFRRVETSSRMAVAEMLIGCTHGDLRAHRVRTCLDSLGRCLGRFGRCSRPGLGRSAKRQRSWPVRWPSGPLLRPVFDRVPGDIGQRRHF